MFMGWGEALGEAPLVFFVSLYYALLPLAASW
jgi:hypothetical protein